MVCGATGACGGAVAGDDLHRPGKPCGAARSPATPARPSASSRATSQRPAVRDQHGLQAGNCAACTAGSACQPANPCHAGINVCSPTIDCTDTGRRQRRRLRHQPGLQRRNVRRVRRGRELPADQPLQDRRDVVRDRSSGLRGVGKSANGTAAARTWCATTGSLRDLRGRRRLHADAIPATPGRSAARRAPPCAPTAAQPVATGPSAARTWCARRATACRAPRARPASRPTRARTARRHARPARWSAWRRPTRASGTLCGAGQSCAGGEVTLPAMCNASGACAAATMACPSQTCNTAGTDCATCPTGQTSCPNGCKDLTRDVMNCGAVRQRLSGAPAGGGHRRLHQLHLQHLLQLRLTSSACPCRASPCASRAMGLRGHDAGRVQDPQQPVGGGEGRHHQRGGSHREATRSGSRSRPRVRRGRRASTRSARRCAPAAVSSRPNT